MGCTKEADLSDLGACCAWEMHRSQHNQEHTGDPVNVVTGAFTLVETDFAVPCQRLPLVFTRAYDSQAHAFEPAGDLGPGWTHSFALRIERKEGIEDVVYVDDRHTRLEFRCVDGRLRVPEGAQGMRLASTPTGWTLRQLDGLGADFDTDGRLTLLYRPGSRRDSVLTLYHASDRLERVEGATGALLFDWADGRIVAISTPAGRWGYDYDAEGRLVAVTRPSGITQRYAYASDKHVVTVLDVDPKSDVSTPRRESREITGMRHVFAPAAPGEREVALVTNVYTSEYRVALQVDAVGGETRFAYNQFTRMTAVTDPEGWTTVHAYDKAGNTVRVLTPEGRVTEFVYDARRNLLATLTAGRRIEHVRFADEAWFERGAELASRAAAQRSDFLQFVPTDIVEAYDDAGNAPLRRDANGDVTRYSEYTPFGQPGRVKFPDGRELRTTFDDRSGLPLRRERWSGGTLERWWEWTRDDVGNVVLSVEGSGDGPLQSETSVYDPTGTLVVRQESHVGVRSPGFPSVEHRAYDAAGRLVRRVTEVRSAPDAPPRGRTERYGYDADGNLAWEARGGEARAFDWDPRGNLLTLSRLDPSAAPGGPRTVLERREYDDAGRCVGREDATGGRTRYQYDGCGRTTRIDGPGTPPTTFVYDRDGAIIEQSGPDGTLRTDEGPNGVTAVDDLERRLETERDLLGRTVRLTRDGAVTTWDYSPLKVRKLAPDGTWHEQSAGEPQLSELGPAPHLQVEWHRDALGRPLELRSGEAASPTTRRRWEWLDHLGKRVEREADGTPTTIRVDSSGALVARRRGEVELTYERDEEGRLVRWHSSDGTLDRQYAYGVDGQLASVTSPGWLERWERDAAGRPVLHHQEIDGVPFQVRLEWGSANQLREARTDGWWMRIETGETGDASRVELPGRTVEIRREAHRHEVRWDDGSSSVTEHRREGIVSWSQEAGGRRWQWTYAWDALGRLGRELRETPAGKSELVYRYDAADRLVAVEDGVGREVRGWAWDGRGNLLEAREQGGVVARWTVDELDRIREWTGADGRPLGVEYDTGGRLVRAGTFRAAYDAGGHPREIGHLTDVRCGTDGSLTAWTREGHRERVGWCLGRPVCFPGEVQAFWFDEVVLACSVGGRTRAVWTDPRGSIVGIEGLSPTVGYDPWGVADEVLPLPLGYEGRLRAAGVYDNRARVYLPGLARFAQPDPDGIADDPNVYLYGHGNPLRWTDTTGHAATRSGVGCLAHMPAVDLLPLVSIEAFRAAGIEVASTWIQMPGFLDISSRAHYVHRSAAGEVVGRTRVVGPGWLESRPHFVHSDVRGERVGSSYIKSPGLLDTMFGLLDPPPHLDTYNANSERVGSVWVRPPGFMDIDQRSHLASYDAAGDSTGTTRLVLPGRFESHPHLVHHG